MSTWKTSNKYFKFIFVSVLSIPSVRNLQTSINLLLSTWTMIRDSVLSTFSCVREKEEFSPQINNKSKQRERQRDREGQRDRDKERYIDRDRVRYRDIETETERQRKRDRQRQRDRDKDKEAKT